MGDGRAVVGSALAAAAATLLCCALPSLLVLAGMGTTVAAVVSAAPWLVTLSRHKEWVFLAAGLLLAGSRLYLARVVPRVASGGVACPTAVARWTSRAWWLSALLYAAAFFVAFVLGPILTRMDA